MTRMNMSDFPALLALQAHLDAQEGRIGATEAPLAIAALREFLVSGAAMGRRMRETTAALRPADATGAAIAYLFVVTVDAATHDGREGALAAYASSEQPLATEAGELYAMLRSDDFLEKVGRRPVQGSHRGCVPGL